MLPHADRNARARFCNLSSPCPCRRNRRIQRISGSAVRATANPRLEERSLYFLNSVCLGRCLRTSYKPNRTGCNHISCCTLNNLNSNIARERPCHAGNAHNKIDNLINIGVSSDRRVIHFQRITARKPACRCLELLRNALEFLIRHAHASCYNRAGRSTTANRAAQRLHHVSNNLSRSGCRWRSSRAASVNTARAGYLAVIGQRGYRKILGQVQFLARRNGQAGNRTAAGVLNRQGRGVKRILQVVDIADQRAGFPHGDQIHIAIDAVVEAVGIAFFIIVVVIAVLVVVTVLIIIAVLIVVVPAIPIVAATVVLAVIVAVQAVMGLAVGDILLAAC